MLDAHFGTRSIVTRTVAILVMLALVTGLIESGLDLSGVADSDDHAGTPHELHGHLGSDGLPADEDPDIEHYCHCVTHGAALAFSFDIPVDSGATQLVLFRPSDYRSLAIPPPVPPPNA